MSLYIYIHTHGGTVRLDMMADIATGIDMVALCLTRAMTTTRGQLITCQCARAKMVSHAGNVSYQRQAELLQAPDQGTWRPMASHTVGCLLLVFLQVAASLL